MVILIQKQADAAEQNLLVNINENTSTRSLEAQSSELEPIERSNKNGV
jgi:hypothetical protein